MLEVPVSVTGNNYLQINYQISSPRIVLVALQSNANSTKESAVVIYDDQYIAGGWRDFAFPLDADVEAVQLVAKKTGATTNFEYVLIGSLSVTMVPYTGNLTLMCYVEKHVLFC